MVSKTVHRCGACVRQVGSENRRTNPRWFANFRPTYFVCLCHRHHRDLRLFCAPLRLDWNVQTDNKISTQARIRTDGNRRLNKCGCKSQYFRIFLNDFYQFGRNLIGFLQDPTRRWLRLWFIQPKERTGWVVSVCTSRTSVPAQYYDRMTFAWICRFQWLE